MSGEDLKLEFEDEDAKDEDKLPEVDLEFSVSEIRIDEIKKKAEQQASEEKPRPVAPERNTEQQSSTESASSAAAPKRQSMTASRSPSQTGSRSIKRPRSVGTRTIELRKKIRQQEDQKNKNENKVREQKPLSNKEVLEGSFHTDQHENLQKLKQEGSAPMKLREFRVKPPQKTQPSFNNTELRKEKMQKANIRDLSDIDPTFKKPAAPKPEENIQGKIAMAVAEAKIEFISEFRSEAKIADYRVTQLLKRMYQKHPDLKAEIIQIRKIIQALATGKKDE